MNVLNRSLKRMAIAAFITGGLFAGTASADAISGAIFTTDGDGGLVNGNNYELKSDVYLNGGPNRAPCSASRLDDDDDYYFQVTDPSGAMLLSEDGIEARKFGVNSDGVIDGLGATPAGTHATGAEAGPCASVTVQLMPFANTPNPGGVYKVWITRVRDFEAACGGPGIDCGLAGFVPGHTKTDNFRTREDGEEDKTGALKAYKFYDANASGTFDAGDLDLPNWPMTLTSDNQQVDSTKLTGANGKALFAPLLPDVDYYVTEGTPNEANWVHSATIYAGKGDSSPQNPAGPLVVVVDQTTLVKFGNYCTVPSNGRTLGFWSNKNGQKLIDAYDLWELKALNLRNGDGSIFDPATKESFRTWLLDGNAVNMAYMLSVQLAAMKLNVYNGFVNGGATYVPAGMTINELMAAADASLAAYPVTTADNDPFNQRDNQEELKNWLDELNNGAGVLSPTPCSYTFP